MSSVMTTVGMFRGATSFNGDLSKWDVSRVKDMGGMFQNAGAFDQKFCTAAWVYSKASKSDMFEGSSGSISQTVCTSTPTPHQYTSQQPIPERELIVRKPISTSPITSTIDRTIMCARCGTFRKSGRVSCCAPGGAWFKNCGGGLSSKNVHHRWSEGVVACTRKFKADNI